MSFPQRVGTPRGDWSSTTASSSDTSVQYAEGNVVTWMGELWYYTSTTIGATGQPDQDAAWTQISGTGAVPPTPQEHFTFTLAPNVITSGTGVTAVTGTVGVEAPFVYTGFNGTVVHGPTTINTTNPETGDSTQTAFSFNVPNNTPGTYQVSVRIMSQNSSGDAQPAHTVTGTVTVAAQYFTLVSTTVPAGTNTMQDQGGYANGVTFTERSISSTSRLYVALPDTVTPRFTSGGFPVVNTEVTTGFSTMGYNLWDLGLLTDGTFTVEIQDA